MLALQMILRLCSLVPFPRRCITMNTIKYWLTWQRLVVLCGFLVLVPAALLLAGPPPKDAPIVTFDYYTWAVDQAAGTATITITMTGEPTEDVSAYVFTDDTGTAIPYVDY